MDMPLTPQCSERVVHLSSSSATAVIAGGGESGGGRHQTPSSSSRCCPAVDALLAVHDRIIRGDAADEGEMTPEAEAAGTDEGSEEEEEVEARLLIDTSQIGAVLGKGGCIISATRKATGARLRVLPARELPACSAPGDELLRISGSSRGVRAALRLVAEQLRANPPRKAGVAGVAAEGSSSAAAAAAAAVSQQQQQQQQQQQMQMQLQMQQQQLYQQHHPTAALAAALAVLNDDGGEEEDNDAGGSDGGSPFLFSHHHAASRHSSSPFFSSPMAAGPQSPFSPLAREFTPAAGGQQQQKLPPPSFVASADVSFRLLVPARAIGTVIGRGGDVARRLRAESGAWLKVHPAVVAESGAGAAAEATVAAERVVQLSSSCSSSPSRSSGREQFCSSPQSPGPSTPAAAAAAAAGLSSPSRSNSLASSSSPPPPPLFLNAFSASFAAASPQSPSSSHSTEIPICPAVSALIACVRLVLADGGGVGARHSVRLLVAGNAALALMSKSDVVSAPPSFGTSSPPSAPEHGSLLSDIAAATGATFRAEPAVAAAAEDGSPEASASPSPRLATATLGDVVLTISGAATPTEAAIRALATALVRLQVSEAAARNAAKRASVEMNNTLSSSPVGSASPSRLGPWRSPVVSPPPPPPLQQQQQQHLRYDLWESGSSHDVAAGAVAPQQQQQQQQLFPSTTTAAAVVIVLRLDQNQAAAALGPAGANLAAVAAASGACVRLFGGGGNGRSDGNASSGNFVGLELSGGLAQVESARAVVSAFVLAAGARPL